MLHVALGVRRLRLSIPLGPAYLAAVLRRAGHRVTLFEYGAGKDGDLSALLADPPDIAAYSVLSGEQRDCIRFHRLLRKSHPVPSILGGPHPTFHPEILLEEGVDAICIGEGEEAILEFAERFEAGGRIPRGVRNIQVKREDGQVEASPVRPLIRDLDALPFPDRASFARRHPLLRSHGVRHFMAQRGCPHACTFCFNQGYHRLYGGSAPPVRSRDPLSVCAEIVSAREEGPLEMVSFVDDTFAHDPGWVERFCGAYSRYVKLPYSVNLRADDRIPALAARLSESGCRLAYVGVEAGCDASRRLLGRRMDDKTIRAALDALKRHGIRTITENMVGIPGETFGQALRTLRLNAVMRPTLANCSIFTPYPGLPLTVHAVRKGWFDGNFDRLEGGFYRTSVLEFSSAAERNRIVNLRAFFSILSRHPRLLPAFMPLLRLPPNRLFEAIGTLADGYYLRRCLPYRQGVRRSLRLLAGFLKLYRD
jgi:radical SAM superfamily enzyme YgiQ (UPF0313 family)